MRNALVGHAVRGHREPGSVRTGRLRAPARLHPVRRPRRFTTLSETRDPDEVRELLSRYFEASRQLVARYGGTVEKFIGDAVMAVWGTPIAQEDDAERAVRAAIDLVEAVAALSRSCRSRGFRLAPES